MSVHLYTPDHSHVDGASVCYRSLQVYSHTGSNSLTSKQPSLCNGIALQMLRVSVSRRGRGEGRGGVAALR